MPGTVWIYGMSRNLASTPVPPPEAQVWVANAHRGYYRRLARMQETNEWTHWFNLHSTRHMTAAYPKGYAWYGRQTKPIYLREVDPAIPASRRFERDEIQAYFGGPQMGSPGRYFVCTITWLIARAIWLRAACIRLWGFALPSKPQKPHNCYLFERPCVFYWIQQARDRGITVTYQPEIAALPYVPGDPAAYTGPLYGYETT